MKNITVSITDLQHRRLRIWAAQRGCSASFIVRSVLEDLPQLGRALRAINAHNLAGTGIPSSPGNQALVNLLKPVPRNKKSAQISAAKPKSSKQPAPDQAVTPATSKTENTMIACGTVHQPAQ